MNIRILPFLFLLVTSISLVKGDIRLPSLISDGMILQRDQELNIWGWADADERVTISFNHLEYTTVTSKDGKWSITLPAISAGGPYIMILSGKNEITVNNILIGDVWVCSGQSNMAFKMDRVKTKYIQEIASSYNRNIRQFLVKPSWSFSVQDDVESDGWKEASPENILDFTAVGYFFAKEVYENINIPIGIINTSYSATVAEAWISEKGLLNFPNYVAEARHYNDVLNVQKVLDADRKLKLDWDKLVKEEDQGLPHNKNDWRDPSLDISSWDTLSVPGFWSKPLIRNKPGVVWQIKEIEVPSYLIGKDALLYLGAIDDRDNTYFNGIKIGNSYLRGRDRVYPIPGELVKNGSNRVVVRIVNPDGPGGFYPDKDSYFASGSTRIDLAGSWKYNIGASLPSFESKKTTKFNCKPTAVFNNMIAPLTNYIVKGVVWYQGEGNAGRAYEYRQLFSDLIVDWRERWNKTDLPFVFVQLPNYGKVADSPVESSWAELRESQAKALNLPFTGMAVTHDLGETNDIHPQDKKSVGTRLALVTLDKFYHTAIISSGPVYKSMVIKEDKIIVAFENVSLGLITNDNKDLKYFSIAGKDQQFVWAKAKIEGDSVIVWSDAIKKPVAVRYAWANNPLGANLYNKEGLPARSFRTDSWKGKTQK